jgi:hypothetical protein
MTGGNVMKRMIRLNILLLLLAGASPAPGAAPEPPPLPEYPTRFYTIYSDLDPDGIREAKLRMTAMAREYSARTAGFSGAITRPMPFYLYSKLEDYLATGAPEGTAGYFSNGELVAFAGDLGPRTWNTVQHEGFHEFAHFVIRGKMPMWVNEGLAEYFGEGLYTGDGFVLGLIPQFRLKRIQENLRAEKFKPFEQFMNLTRGEWNEEISLANYDQAWSMVHFLAHGHDNKYQKALGEFMNRIGDGGDPDRAWNEIFGNIHTFQTKWRDYWLSLPQNPTLDRYIDANVEILTGFYARAFSQRQSFPNFDAFQTAGEAGVLKAHPDEWLPPRLLKFALEQARMLMQGGYTYSLSTQYVPPRLICTAPDGRKFIGQFTIRMGKVTQVRVDELAPH